MGKQKGKLVQVTAVDIHGSKFYDIVFTLDSGSGGPRASRIGQESVYPNPQPGDDVLLHLVLGQLTKVEKRILETP